LLGLGDSRELFARLKGAGGAPAEGTEPAPPPVSAAPVRWTRGVFHEEVAGNLTRFDGYIPLSLKDDTVVYPFVRKVPKGWELLRVVVGGGAPTSLGVYLSRAEAAAEGAKMLDRSAQ
jgi:hypothetical protein